MEDVKDCAWCGLPMEVVSRWDGVKRVWDGERTMTYTTPNVTARCINEHWYGGPASVLQEGDQCLA